MCSFVTQSGTYFFIVVVFYDLLVKLPFSPLIQELFVLLLIINDVFAIIKRLGRLLILIKHSLEHLMILVSDKFMLLFALIARIGFEYSENDWFPVACLNFLVLFTISIVHVSTLVDCFFLILSLRIKS